MILHVPFDKFAETVKRVLRHSEAYLELRPTGVLATAGHPTDQTIVAAWGEGTLDAARAAPEHEGMTVGQGSWSRLDEPSGPGIAPDGAYVAAVSYASGDDRAGVWVDAFPSLPTHMQILRAMYDEFVRTGEVGDATFEEFVRFANPNVVVVSPGEIAGYLADKEPGDRLTSNPDR